LFRLRKPGNSRKNTAQRYTLEYGSGILEIHDDALHRRDRVLIIDDVLATEAPPPARTLVRECGATVVAADSYPN